MSSPRQYIPGDVPVPGYRLLAHLGSGGLGDVWKAEAPGGAEVALKIISGLGETSALKELHAIQLVKNIRHPNLVPIHGIWLKDEQGKLLDDNWFATETGSGRVKIKVKPPNESSTTIFREPGSSSGAEGRKASGDELGETRQATPDPHSPSEETPGETAIPHTIEPKTDTAESDLYNQDIGEAELLLAMGLASENLFDRLQRYKQQGLHGLPPGELLDYFTDAAKAIDLMNHEHGIQHCDIKPKNLLVAGGSVQVCDFGLAQALDRLRKTRTSAFTVAYAAPEVVSLQRPSPNTDQYCLAISYYELRTGELPFKSQNVQGVLREKQQGDLQLSRLLAKERAVIGKATALLPEARYPTCAEMVKALRKAVEAEVESETNRPEPVASPRARNILGILAVVSVVLALVAAFMWSQNSSHRSFSKSLEVYRQGNTVFSAELNEACLALEELPHDGAYAKGSAQLQSAWLQKAQKIESSLASQENSDAAFQFLRAKAQQRQARDLRVTILLALAESALQELRTDRIEAATAAWSRINEYLEAYPEDAAPNVRRITVLGEARTKIRRIPSDTQQLASDLSQLSELKDFERPRVQDFRPQNRAPALAMLCLVAKERGYRRLVPLLHGLKQPVDLWPYLTDWERSQIERLQDRTREEVESLDNVPEPWKTMSAELWLAQPKPSSVQSPDALNR